MTPTASDPIRRGSTSLWVQINVRVSLADWDGLLGRLVSRGQELEERRLGPEVVWQIFDCRLF